MDSPFVGAIGPDLIWTLCLDEGWDFQIQDANADGWGECPDGATSDLLIGSMPSSTSESAVQQCPRREICLPPSPIPDVGSPKPATTIRLLMAPDSAITIVSDA